MTDILADICGISQDKAATLRLLAERSGDRARHELGW